MADYYWKLQRYKGQNTRFRCPECRGGKQYTRFVNSSGQYAPYEYGKCNRVEKCGYFNYPKKNGHDTRISGLSLSTIKMKREPQSFIDWNEYKYDLNTDNDLFQYIFNKTKASKESILKAFKMYRIGTDKNRLIFPFIDKDNRLTYVKSIYYLNGHRTNNIYTPFKAKDGRFKQCLFGLHLLEHNKVINVVESEKTALIMSIIAPQYIWMATGGLNFYNKIKVLGNATIFADKGKAFNYWASKLDLSKYYMHTVLEVTDLPEGSDLADYYLNKI
ncbi:DUF6371 domain-containing protein [Psychroserpens jangbogonensis]|uniref:DUF6371 domain-containing protein n=1 Tax=Psychroserpens jangbogonensis TaxID=1484460 RepID=UPI00053F1CB9|nr:DUF6371 domain-containing protein [Psychroserpens jangbogonensis]